MKSPQLERLLSFSFHTSITLRNGILLIDECRSTDMDDASKGVVADDYYKALKVISLCGWEPRLLPYSIDLEDGSDPSAQCISSLESWEQIDGEPKQNITSCSSSCNDGEGRNEISPVLSDRLNDPASTALDCRLCGTCVEEDLNQDNDDEPQAADSMKRKRSEVENYNSQTQMQGGVDDLDRDTGSCESSPATKLADAEESRDGYVASYRVDAPENNNIKGPSFQTAEKRKRKSSTVTQIAKNASLSNPHEEDANHISGTLKLKLLDFDPIMQHRPFCPWSASDDSKSFPGWKATLSALDNQENSSSQRPGHSDSDSMLLDEVDDPILSVRKHFHVPPRE
ncbi:hypothetical protein HPP92_024704 [Vanilla planifolia]|uniref:Uncharacterized protein n=1 Tax=Vanilla planifolia TaxID=51239 RepID=A0A835PSM3_VANPL|nr:hypothetical protein HPP92_024704 [Vanilla planifolia]